MTIEEIGHWIATDTSDFAQSIREMFRPFIDQLASLTYDATLDFGYGDHRHIMRRKIRRCYRD